MEPGQRRGLGALARNGAGRLMMTEIQRLRDRVDHYTARSVRLEHEANASHGSPAHQALLRCIAEDCRAKAEVAREKADRECRS